MNFGRALDVTAVGLRRHARAPHLANHQPRQDVTYLSRETVQTIGAITATPGLRLRTTGPRRCKAIPDWELPTSD